MTEGTITRNDNQKEAVAWRILNGKVRIVTGGRTGIGRATDLVDGWGGGKLSEIPFNQAESNYPQTRLLRQDQPSPPMSIQASSKGIRSSFICSSSEKGWLFPSIDRLGID